MWQSSWNGTQGKGAADRNTEVVCVSNATIAVNIVARSLALQPGDEVLGTDHEYGACDRIWRFICARRGARYVRAPVRLPVRGAEEIVEAVWSHVTPRTRVLFISHLTSPTALIFPVEPLILSWGWESDHPGPSRFIDEQEWQGTKDLAASLTVPAAIEFMRQHRWDQVQQQCSILTRHGRTELTDLTGLPPLSPDGPEWYAQMVSVPLPCADPEAFQRRLYEEFHIEVPVQAWNGQPLIRISVQAYNSAHDLAHLTAALRLLLPAAAPRSGS